MYARAFLKLSAFYIIMSITQAATLDLCVTKRDNINTNFRFRVNNEIQTNRLLLRDCPVYPFVDNAVDHIRSFIVNKLDLPHLEWRILQATYTDKGLLFEMSSSKDVEEILEQFAVKLQNKECTLKTTLKSFFPTEIR
ncbi:uncharacterized protein LOC119607841 [Lucilia sericata]|uniref:uncharacterized protein LOC119607841 n=1 Tax=Lucilia sericata TaxID=13632 RepID=UPI0018A829C0|nr:uncharacterized protein LOC119607841 [Lucilia sericata]